MFNERITTIKVITANFVVFKFLINIYNKYIGKNKCVVWKPEAINIVIKNLIGFLSW